MNKYLSALIPGILLLFSTASLSAQIGDFTVRESDREGESIELIALDGSGDPQREFSGSLPFSVNGFEVEMNFREGRASFPRDLVSSTFLYVKYEGEARSRTRLFYVYPGFVNGFTVLHIPLVLLVAVPLALVLIGMFFRRLIILVVLLLGAFFYFNSSRGLSLSSFFDGIKEWVNGLLQMIVPF